MEPERTQTHRSVSVERVIDAPASAIFDVVASPDGHARIDGSGTVRAASDAPERLELGSVFRMRMKLGIPYAIANTVVEYEADRRLAWAHVGGHRWRFTLEPIGDASTTVRQTFDWSTALFPAMIELLGHPRRHPVSMARTLARLASEVESHDRVR